MLLLKEGLIIPKIKNIKQKDKRLVQRYGPENVNTKERDLT